MFRAVKLLSNQLSKPSQDSFGSGHRSYLVQTLSAEPFADLTERGALVLRKPKPIGQLCPKYAVLSGNILHLQQQLLVDQPADVRQNTKGLTTFHPGCM